MVEDYFIKKFKIMSKIKIIGTIVLTILRGIIYRIGAFLILTPLLCLIAALCPLEDFLEFTSILKETIKEDFYH